jgi:Cu+-exporting ATPase
VNLATEHATVWTDGASAPPAAGVLIAAVQAAGYQAEIARHDLSATARAEQRSTELRRQRLRLFVAAVLGVPVLADHMVLSGVLPWPVAAALTAAVLVVGGGPMISGALRALVRRTANMDLLVSLGALVALASSLAGALTHTHALMLFESAVMIVLFVGLGKYLEARARGQSSAALEALLTRLPRTALRLVNGTTEAISIDAVRVGDRLRVAAQTLVPVDGQISAGRGTLNEAILTGESLPVERGEGDTVFGGTVLVDGLLEVQASATGSASAAARIAQLVEEAQATKPPWQLFADRVASVFVPAVLVLAAATFLGWKLLAGADNSWALQRMIAVLVVACPCALGLAIPTAVLVSTTRAAARGILVRDAAALEAAGQIREVVFDKTGTLTAGQPALTRIVICDARSESEVLRAAAALEQLSAHPLARAVVTAARTRGLDLPQPVDLHVVPGGGISGTVDGARLVIGSANWLRENGADAANATAAGDALAAEGLSVVCVAFDGRIAALMGFSDPLHSESVAALAALRRLDIRVRLLSGDRLAAVRSIAEQLGIEEYEAQLSPEQKLTRIRELVAAGHRVAMVGDGINDAPALAAAGVGIALGTGADVAREAAAICLVGHNPRLVAEAIRIARAGARTMKQNLFWALVYNLVMLPVAIFAPLPPGLATAAMMGSSLSVVGNSLRLNRAI